MIRRAILLLPLLSLTYCKPPPEPTGQARADAATIAACRDHANQVYDRQNRDQIYTITNRDVPFSAAYAPGVTNRGLAARYAHDNMVSDCVRNTGTETDRTTTYTPDATEAP
jgi:hypothetical protein